MTKNYAENLVMAILVIALVLVVPLTISNIAKGLKIPSVSQTKQHGTGFYSLLIDTDEKRIYLFEDGKLILKYLCATGKDSTPSPLGYFEINKKSLWGEGFGGYYLGINCTWGNYGIHGTTDPSSVGSDASHGCFRMYNQDIEKLYGLVHIGTPVLIVSGIYGAFGYGFRTIGPGMYGYDVQQIQKRLKDLGYFKGVCNGRYDSPGFQSAIYRFQRDHGLTVSNKITEAMYTAMGFEEIE